MIMEEALLIEQSHKGRSGVDLPLVPLYKNRTGQPERSFIGLPEVSEPQVVRHFVRLSQQNFSIDTNFYPLGSCTMKHNPRLNEKMARLSGFNIHPMQPESTIQGALELMHELENWLKELTGLPGITLNPAAGAHGEMAGVLVIHKAHEMRGRQRKIVLVPDNAHGTNPATAAMCGYEIKTIRSTPEGIVDMEALEAALNEDVAAFMLTNPSTVGIFEPNAKKIADMLHKVGAFFYCDGANFNAIVGKVRPADFGVDVMHINLHKTFSTPHGGGGPGSGPIVVCEELIPYLPVPVVVKKADGRFSLIDNDTFPSVSREGEGKRPVSNAAPELIKNSIGRMKAFQGHFGMYVRALSYMLSHGADGMRKASEDAVLSANYILASLRDKYFVPFPNHHCMHECLLTDKTQKGKGISTMEIAKTLIDEGIHPMTVFFPLVVQGAMLIEPTESETKETLDNFISIMRRIADDVESGKGEEMKLNPRTAPRSKLDEVQAAKFPKLTWAELLEDKAKAA